MYLVIMYIFYDINRVLHVHNMKMSYFTMNIAFNLVL